MRETNYPLMIEQLQGLIESCPLPLPALANCAALLWDSLDELNWVGFYLRKDDKLILGPFQGKVACTVIPSGRGVCGTALQTSSVQLVPDVHLFPGHIACDAASNSELVIPLMVDGACIGVLDIDSPQFSRFSEQDAQNLEVVCKMLTTQLSWKDGLL